MAHLAIGSGYYMAAESNETIRTLPPPKKSQFQISYFATTISCLLESFSHVSLL